MTSTFTYGKRATFALISRNLKLFFRDRLNVFFSLLGALILFLIYALFLGEMQVESVSQTLPEVAHEDVQFFVNSWMFSGIVTITTFTTGLGAFSTLVDDGQSGRFKDFLVSPARPHLLTLGYISSALVVSLLMSFAVLVLSVLYLGVSTGTWLSLVLLLRLAAITALCCAAFTALAAFMVSFVRTAGANAGLNTVVGTVMGFIAAAYIPVGAFPPAVANVASALPFGQAGMLLRREFTEPALGAVTSGNVEAASELRAMFGIDLTVGSWEVSSTYTVLALAAMFVVFTALAALRIRSRIR